MSYATHVPAVARALALLEAVAAAPAGLSAGDLEESLNISRSSLFALLNTLKERNYLEQVDNRGRYRIGPALYTLLPTHLPELAQLIDAFQTDPAIAALDETAALARLEGDDAVIIAQRESSRAVRVVLRLGQRRPAAACAEGQVLLAALQPPPTAILAQVQRQGYAQTRTEETLDLACPICPDGHQPGLALLLSAPAFRGQAEPEKLLNTLRQIAARLSYRLGAPVYQPYGQALAQTVEPTTPLPPAELGAFLKGAWGARLACIRPDGRPHVVPLWYEWDGKHFWITASPNANWAGHVRLNPQVSLTVDEPWPPLRRVLVISQAHPVPEETIPGGMAGLRGRLAARYLGRSAAIPDPAGHTEWQAFLLTPQKIISHRGLEQ